MVAPDYLFQSPIRLISFLKHKTTQIQNTYSIIEAWFEELETEWQYIGLMRK